jgi:uncharacterized protein
MRQATDVVLRTFRAVEERDAAALAASCLPDAEFHWPPSLPYGGVHALGRRDWTETWDPLQDDRERIMDPRVIAASNSQVVVLWQQRGHTQAGKRFEMPVLGLYDVRDEKLARARMFYFDSHAVREFLTSAQRDAR